MSVETIAQELLEVRQALKSLKEEEKRLCEELRQELKEQRTRLGNLTVDFVPNHRYVVDTSRYETLPPDTQEFFKVFDGSIKKLREAAAAGIVDNQFVEEAIEVVEYPSKVTIKEDE